MKKCAQGYSAFSSLQGKNLGDLFQAIRQDTVMPIGQKARVISQVKGVTGFMDPSTPLSALLHRGLGGTIGWLLSKYFGMSPVGQIISTMAGYGIGRAIHKQLNKPKPLYPGWRVIGSE